jgi:hypothetical protein
MESVTIKYVFKNKLDIDMQFTVIIHVSKGLVHHFDKDISHCFFMLDLKDILTYLEMMTKIWTVRIQG